MAESLRRRTGFDIRLPIGMMFTALGALIGAYGVLTAGDDMYARHSLGININLWWGAVMLLFGAGMLLLARRRSLRCSVTGGARGSTFKSTGP